MYQVQDLSGYRAVAARTTFYATAKYQPALPFTLPPSASPHYLLRNRQVSARTTVYATAQCQPA